MPSAFYNEIEPYACEWLGNLIRSGQITDGVVNESPIQKITGRDIAKHEHAHFFAGIGVWSRALRDAGWPDDRPVWTGSCPCQPFSSAGSRGGIDDERHLWPVWFDLIRECRPPIVFGEQVASTDGLGWLDAVYADMEGAGYAVGAIDFGAASVGAPHRRQRLYFVAIARELGNSGIDGDRQHAGELSRDESEHAIGSAYGDHSSVATGTACRGFWSACDWIPCSDGVSRPVEPGTFPLAHGATARVGRLRAYGNAIVLPQATAFVRSVIDCLKEEP